MDKYTSIPNLKVSLAQIKIKDLDKEYNIDKVKNILSSLKDKSDIVVFPEVFNTGFDESAYEMYEVQGNSYTYAVLKSLSTDNNITIVCSFFVKVNNKIYNRLHFFSPDGNVITQDKRHLFSIAKEDRYISNTNTRTIIEYKGWKILPTICYDIRFPVWCRNHSNEYDILINISNWPMKRQKVLDTLIKARAIENLCYVISVNRCGLDCMNIEYCGGSIIVDPKASTIAKAKINEEDIVTREINYLELEQFRNKFPVYKDADQFTINSIKKVLK